MSGISVLDSQWKKTIVNVICDENAISHSAMLFGKTHTFYGNYSLQWTNDLGMAPSPSRPCLFSVLRVSK